MRLLVLGSGSRGNAFAVIGGKGGRGGDVLLIDAGFAPKTLFRRAHAAGLDLHAVRGIVLTHEHGDHARGGLALAARLGVPVLCSFGTWLALGRSQQVSQIPIRVARPFEFGGFRLEASRTTHDAEEPLAITVEQGGARVAFATDLGRPTAGVRYLLRESQVVVIECNYDEVLLRTGDYPPSVQERIAGSRGHLSNRAAADLLADVCHKALHAVVLAHLSQQCNSPSRARATVEPVLRGRGFRGAIWVAEQDRPLPPIRVRAGLASDQGDLFEVARDPDPGEPEPHSAAGSGARSGSG